jgi:DNA-binding transcriptional LysR family regulator
MMFQKVAPGVRLIIRTDGNPALERMVLDGEIELAVVTDRSFQPSLAYETFRPERMVFFVPSRHPLARKARPATKDLAGFPLLIGKTEAGLLRRLEEKGLDNVSICSDSPWAVKNAVDAGLGIGLLYRNMVAPDVKRGSMKILRLSDLSLDIESHIVFHRERPYASHALLFLDLLRQWPQTSCSAKNSSLSHISTQATKQLAVSNV